MCVILNLIFSIAAGVLSFVALFNKSTYLIIIIAQCIIAIYILDRAAGKLKENAWFSYIILGIIGAIFIKPWFFGFVIANGIFEGIGSIIGMPKILKNIKNRCYKNNCYKDKL